MLKLVATRIEMGHLFRNSSHKTSSESGGFETMIWITKVVLMSVGVVSSLLLVWISVIPSVSSFLLSTLPRIWSFFRSFLSPPYVYILLNLIILSIAFSSSLQHQIHMKNPKKIKTFLQGDEFEDQELVVESRDEEAGKKTVVEEPLKHLSLSELSIDVADIEDILHSVSHITFPGRISRESSAEEKQMAIVEPDKPEEPDDDDSLDAIWKSIMEGEGKKPQLKKCETWGSPPEVEVEEADDPAVWAKREMRKSETFKENVSMKREKLLSQDELNLRADAFIKKVNREMKLEREESQLRYMETVNRPNKVAY